MEKVFSKEEIKNKVIELLAAKFAVECDEIHPDTNLTATLGADSLDLVELIMTMEKTFGVSIKDSDSQRFQTVEDVTEYLESILIEQK